MKENRFKHFTAIYKDGSATVWKYRYTNWTSVGVYKNGVCQKPKKERGWELIDCDGLSRVCEGNWNDFVPFANLILENYGMKTRFTMDRKIETRY